MTTALDGLMADLDGREPLPTNAPSAEDDLLDALRALEWSGYRRGPGSGPMFSGDDGHPFAACPMCGGLKEPASGHFMAEAVGHRQNCRVGNAIARATGATS